MIEIEGYRPGDLGAIVVLHARYYSVHWGFGLAFETKIATEMAEFLSRIDPARDLFLVARDEGRVLGSVAIDASGGGPRGAHLRWFIVTDGARGAGLGGKLLARAISFCDERGYPLVWLTTFAGLEPARILYEKQGFRLVEESDVDQWKGGVREQLYERVVPQRAGGA